MAQSGCQPQKLMQLGIEPGGIVFRPAFIQRGGASFHPTENDVSARDLPHIDHFTGNFGGDANDRVNEPWQGFRHAHLRAGNLQRHRLPQSAGKPAAPCAAGDQHRGRAIIPFRRRHPEILTGLFDGQNLAIFHDRCAIPPRRTGKGGRNEARIGVTIMRRP